MVTRAQLTQATAAAAVLDQLNAAIDALSNGGSVTGITVTHAAGGLGSPFSVDVALPTNAVLTLLTNRANNLQAQLTAMGVAG